MPLCGGHTVPRSPTAEERKFLTTPEILKMVLEGAYGGSALDQAAAMEPIQISTQVVAGTNYRVKYHVGGTSYVHATIHEPLPCNTDQSPRLLSSAANKTLEDSL